MLKKSSFGKIDSNELKKWSMKHCKYITFRIFFLCIIYVTTLLFNLSSSRKVIFIKTSIAHCGYHQRGRKGDHMGAVPAHLFVCWLRRQNVEIKREIQKCEIKLLFWFYTHLLLHYCYIVSATKNYIFSKLYLTRLHSLVDKFLWKKIDEDIDEW